MTFEAEYEPEEALALCEELRQETEEILRPVHLALEEIKLDRERFFNHSVWSVVERPRKEERESIISEYIKEVCK